MRVLHICYTDNRGGAAKAATRLHNGLKEKHIDSTILVYKKELNDSKIIIQNKLIEKAFAYIGFMFQKAIVSLFRDRKGNDFSILLFPGKCLKRRVDKINPDIIHIHYLGPGITSFNSLNKLNRKIIWTLHDSFVFTGGCHTPGKCEKYQEACFCCDYLKSKYHNDLSEYLWRQKKYLFQKMGDIIFTAPSHWMRTQAEKSSILKNKIIKYIPNALDTDIFSPLNKNECRFKLGLSPNKKIILAGGSNFEFDKNKGLKYLIEAFNYLDDKDEQLEIVLFGTETVGDFFFNNIKVKYWGYLKDVNSLINLYSCVDVVVVPSEQESFGQVAAEAMACGTPVVAFRTSGLIDIIDHKINGYLSEPFLAEDLAEGIKWHLSLPESYNIGLNARNKVLNKFDHKIVVEQFIQLYKTAVNGI